MLRADVNHVWRGRVPDETARGKSHPVFYSVQESYERLRTTLKGLPRQHAVVTTNDGHAAIQTLSVPPTKTTREALERLKEGFAQRLLTSRARAIALVDGQKPPDDEPPPPFG